MGGLATYDHASGVELRTRNHSRCNSSVSSVDLNVDRFQDFDHDVDLSQIPRRARRDSIGSVGSDGSDGSDADSWLSADDLDLATPLTAGRPRAFSLSPPPPYEEGEGEGRPPLTSEVLRRASPALRAHYTDDVWVREGSRPPTPTLD